MANKYDTISDREDIQLTMAESYEGRIAEGGLRTKGYIKCNQKGKPLITVVTAVYNGSKYLEQAIQSVINQTYSNVEYIIIDGGSTDGTLDILRKYDNQISYWVSEPDSGIYDAWNKALSICHGSWISFLGCDDYYWDSHVFDKSIRTLTSCQDTTYFVYGKMIQLTDGETVIETFGTDWSLLRDDFMKLMNLPHPGAFHNSRLFGEFGCFNSNFKVAGDYEMLLRALKNNPEGARFMPDVLLVAMRDGGVSGSLSSRKTMVLETKLARKVNGLKSVSLPLLWWQIRVDIILIVEKLLGKKRALYMADLYRRIQGKVPRWSI